MATRYVLETEIENGIKDAYSTAKANDYLLNGRHSKDSDIEKKVRNGTVVITKRQARSILRYIEALPLDAAYEKAAERLDIDRNECPRVMKELDRHGYVNYTKESGKCTLTQKGRMFRNGHARKKGRK